MRDIGHLAHSSVSLALPYSTKRLGHQIEVAYNTGLVLRTDQIANVPCHQISIPVQLSVTWISMHYSFKNFIQYYSSIYNIIYCIYIYTYTV